MSTTQTEFGNTTALAKSIAAYLNAQSAASAYCLPLTASIRFARLMDLASYPVIGQPVRVSVFPGQETETRVGMERVFMADYGIHILLQQQVRMDKTGPVDDAASEAQVSLLLQLRSQITESLKSTLQSIADAVHSFNRSPVLMVKSSEDGAYDMIRLESENCFYSITTFTHKAAV